MFSKLDSKIYSKDIFRDVLNGYACKRSRAFLITFVNPFSYQVLLGRNDIVDEFDAFFTDGILLQCLHNIFYPDRKVERLSFDFTSIAHDVFAHAQKQCLNVTLIGASTKEVDKAISNILVMYPLLNIVYSHCGYFSDEDEVLECLKVVSAVNTDILIVGMGTPLQEEFIIKASKQCSNVKLMFTCGGFIMQTAMRADYYHPIIKKLGFRWLQRMVLHKHVRQRVFKDYPVFFIKYIWQHIKYYFKKHD